MLLSNFNYPPANAAGGGNLLQNATKKRFRLHTPFSFSGVTQLATLGTTTKSCLLQVPTDCNYVRFLFRSNNATGATTLKGYVAPTSQLGNGWSAYDGSGTAQTGTPSPWIPLNFASAGADVAPENQSATTAATATIPNDNSWYWSDWVAITTIPRIDGGSGRLLLVRTQALTNPSAIQAQDAGGILTDAATVGYASAMFSSNGAISTLTSSDFIANNIIHFWGAQFYSYVPGYTMLLCGSSITQGTNTVNNRSSWGRIAAKIIGDATGIPISPVLNFGAIATGVPTTALWAVEALRYINLYQPEIVTLQVSNRNDPITAAQQDITWRLVLIVADAVRRNGGTPILVTATPWPSSNAPTAVEDGYRQINNNRARAAAANGGFPLFDWDAVVTDNGSPARLLPAYDSGDQTHPSNAGHTAGGAVFAGLLRSLPV